MPSDRGKGDERDPFEDLDQFFAPIEEVEEPEDLPAAPRREPEAGPPEEEVSEEEAAEALEGLELGIDLPDESDLVDEPAGQEEEPPHAETEEGAGEEPVRVPEAEGEAGEEWDRLRAEALAGEGESPAGAELPTAEEPTTIPEVGPDLEGYPGLAGEEDSGVEVEAEQEAAAAAEFADVGPPGEQPDPEALQAAEHFASGMRESPEEIERELLSDLSEDTGSETVRIEPTPPVSEGPSWEEGREPVAAEGPTWQEGAQAVATDEAPPEPPATGRNVPAALVSGVLLGAAVLALLAINKGAFVILATAAILLAQAELYAVMRTRGLQPATLLGLVCGAFTVVGAYLHGPDAALFGPVLAMGLTVPWYVAAPAAARKHTTANAAATILGVVYVPFMASFAMLLLAFPGDSGKYAFLAMLVLTVLYDVSAYAVGTLWGNRPMAPTVSPNKSWEGALGGTVIILIAAMSVIPLFTPFDVAGVGVAVGLALVIAVVAPLGDLVESAFKRDLGVKDMGSLLPGHGGVLDRIDAVLFAAPAAYFFLRIVLG